MSNVNKIAKERIKKLFDLAEEKAKEENWQLSKRYITLARNIAMKHQLSISAYKRNFCKKCNTYFTSKTSRTRAKKKDMRIIKTCLVCGNIQRYPYAKEKLKKGQ